MKLTKLKIARMESGLRQYEVARAVGISEGELSKLETGRKAATAELLARIEKALGLSVATLAPRARQARSRSISVS